MKNRQRMQQHIVLTKAPCLNQTLGVAAQVQMAEHNPLWHAGGARRIQQRGEVMIRPFDHTELGSRMLCAIWQAATTVSVQRQQMADRVFLAQRGHALLVAAITDHQRRLGIAQKIV